MIIRVATLLVALALLGACAAAPSARPPEPAALVTAPSSVPEATEATATPTSAPEPSATAPGPDQFPLGRCCRGNELEAGTYGLPFRLRLDVSVEIPAGWRIIREDEVSVLALVRGTNVLGDASEYLAFFVLDDDEPAAAFQQSVLEMGAFEIVSGPADVTITGIDGWQVDLAATPNPDNVGDAGSGIPPGTQVVTAIQDAFTEGFAWTTASAEARVTILTLRIDGRDAVIYIEAPADVADTSINDALAILASLRPI